MNPTEGTANPIEPESIVLFPVNKLKQKLVAPQKLVNLKSVEVKQSVKVRRKVGPFVS